MRNYPLVNEDQKPWLDNEDPFIRTFYPLSWGKQNSYVLFSPGIDRFFLVDNYDPWIMLETSRVLSSKVSNIVYVIDHPSPLFDNDDCLEYTTKNKQHEYNNFGGPKVNHHRQSSFMSKTGPDKIVKRGWPVDFESSDRRQALIKLTDYAAFCLRVIHALAISRNFKDPFPEKHYLENYFKGEYPEDFVLHADATTCPIGMDNLIKNILYTSNNISEALTDIHQAWRDYSQQDLSGYRQTFYYCLGLRPPRDLAALGFANDPDKNNDHTIWIV